MFMFTNQSAKKKLITAAVSTLSVALFAIGVVTVTRPATSLAASCPQDGNDAYTNIAYCGIDGSSATNAINDVKKYYNNNSDAAGQASSNVHTDIDTILNNPSYGHAGGTLINGMDTSNTKLGVSKSDGKIYVNNQIVGTDMWIAARWNHACATPFKQVTSTVWTHSYTCFFNDVFPNGVPTLVHFDSTGKADFAVWVPCMNVLTFTPVTPPSSLSCDSLTATEGTIDNTNNKVTYSFVAKATGNNAPITEYDFDFGDNSTDKVMTSRGMASDSHDYDLTNSDTTLTASVTVNATGVASKTCTAPVKIPAKKVPGGQGGGSSLSCVQLVGNAQSPDKTVWTFTVKAKPVDTTIQSYTFDFGNGSTQEITTSNTSATSQSVTYGTGTTHTVTVTVTNGTNSDKCTTNVTVPAVLAATTTAASTTALPNTGAGSVIGLFALTTVAGGLFHHYILRRKFF